MNINETNFDGVKLIESPVYFDKRGFFCETFKINHIERSPFIQDNLAFSLKTGTIRGLHYQVADFAQAKLVGVLSGRIFDVMVDIRPESPTFGLYGWVELYAVGRHPTAHWIYIPRGFAHGYQTLEDNCLVQYKVDNVYSPSHEAGIRWNDSYLAIEWPLENPIVSVKDQKLPLFKEIFHD